jgi:hypothetical protein
MDAMESIPVTLPSRGMLYKGDKIPGGKVTISPWTVAQEEVILRFPIRLLGSYWRTTSTFRIRCRVTTYCLRTNSSCLFNSGVIRMYHGIPWYTPVRIASTPMQYRLT